MKIHVGRREKKLARIADPRIERAQRDHLLDQLVGKGFSGLIMPRDFFEHLGLPDPILKHLRGSFHKIARHPRAGKNLVFGLRQRVVHDVAKLVEKRFHLVVRQQRGSSPHRLAEIADDGGHRPDIRTVRQQAPLDEWKGRHMFVFSGPRKQIHIEMPDQTIVFGLPHLEQLHLRHPSRPLRKLPEPHPEQLLINIEHSPKDLVHGEIGFDLLVVDLVTALAKLVVIIAPIPKIDLGRGGIVLAFQLQKQGKFFFGLRL